MARSDFPAFTASSAASLKSSAVYWMTGFSLKISGIPIIGAPVVGGAVVSGIMQPWDDSSQCPP
jgi:hypothetical protein